MWRLTATASLCARGTPELLSRFNEGLAILRKTGQYDQIYNKWLGVLEPDQVDWRNFAKYGAIVVVPLVLLLSGFASGRGRCTARLPSVLLT